MDWLQSLSEIFGKFWETYSGRIVFLFGLNGTRTTVVGIVILVRVISFLIILPIHRSSLRKVLNSKKLLVSSVDEVIYLLSKAQYSLSEQQNLPYDPCLSLMKTMFESGHFEYIDNLETIKENVKKVEVLLKQRVISDEQWKKIDSQKRSLKTHIFRSKFLGYELNLVTCGVYNLFWGKYVIL